MGRGWTPRKEPFAGQIYCWRCCSPPAICNDGLIGLLAGMAGSRLRTNQRFLAVQRHVSGSIYMTLAISTALVSPGMY